MPELKEGQQLSDGAFELDAASHHAYPPKTGSNGRSR